MKYKMQHKKPGGDWYDDRWVTIDKAEYDMKWLQTNGHTAMQFRVVDQNGKVIYK